MLQRLEITRPYRHLLSPIPVGDERHALPIDFVDGLTFLRPIVATKGEWFERQVNLLGGKLYALTTRLIVEYDAGPVSLRNWGFASDAISILAAFEERPTEVCDDGRDLCFRWADGQECLLHKVFLMEPSQTHEQMAHEAFARFWQFDQGTEITDETRRKLRKKIGATRLAPDIFINGESLASRMSSDKGKSWTFESSDDFPSNAGRTMRFDRRAFLNMIRVADEIDFSASPVCFRHAHGRGMLVERAATLDSPDFGPFDD